MPEKVGVPIYYKQNIGCSMHASSGIKQLIRVRYPIEFAHVRSLTPSSKNQNFMFHIEPTENKS
jgi:hypothetical protein